MVSFIESHRSTLQSFQLLNAAEDNRLLKYENPINKALKSWMTIKEVRLDSEHTADHYGNVPRGQEWTRPADFLSVDGGGYWGEDLRRARLDRFDLTNIDVGFKSYRAWHNIKVLVLNPRLLWNYGLLPDPHDNSSPRLGSIDRAHLLGMKHLAESECETKELAERISRKMGPNLRILSIRDCRFWIERYGGPIWHLADALADPEQRRQINRVLDQRDWDFLSERSTTDTQEAANTAIFLRNDMYSPIQSPPGSIPRPVSRASIISDTVSESESESEDDDEVMNDGSENGDDEVMNHGSENGDDEDDRSEDVSLAASEAVLIYGEPTYFDHPLPIWPSINLETHQVMAIDESDRYGDISAATNRLLFQEETEIDHSLPIWPSIDHEIDDSMSFDEGMFTMALAHMPYDTLASPEAS